MMIEVGKRYIRRDGSVTPPLAVSDFPVDVKNGWIIDPSNYHAYSPNTKWGWMVYGDEEHKCDLMMEYKE